MAKKKPIENRMQTEIQTSSLVRKSLFQRHQNCVVHFTET